MQEVNLLPENEQAQSPVARRNRKITLISMTVLVGFVMVLLAVFGYSVYLSQRIKSIRQQKGPVEQAIGQLAKREYLMRATAAKLDKIEKILKSEPPFRQIVSRLVELEPSGISYTDVTLTAPNKVIISGKAASLAALDKFLADLTAKEFGRKMFSDIVLQSLNRSDRGDYEFSLRFTYIGGS